jgi:septum formation protein
MISWPGWSFNIAPANIDESAGAGEAPLDYVRRIALRKSLVEIKPADADDVVIAADTIVVLDGKILGKPADSQNAFVMLESLRNRSHQVITAISVRQASGLNIKNDICVSDVQMRNYSDEEIRIYIQSGDPLDKAGGYAIQHPEFHPVINFSGCFAGVMGMPLCHLERTLRKIKGYQPREMAALCQKNLQYSCPINKRVMSGEEIG